MERKKLEKQIQLLDEQLSVELALLKLDGRERTQALRRVPPLYWLGASVVGGLLAGKLLGSNGSKQLLNQSGTILRLASLVMPSLALASNSAE